MKKLQFLKKYNVLRVSRLFAVLVLIVLGWIVLSSIKHALVTLHDPRKYQVMSRRGFLIYPMQTAFWALLTVAESAVSEISLHNFYRYYIFCSEPEPKRGSYIYPLEPGYCQTCLSLVSESFSDVTDIHVKCLWQILHWAAFSRLKTNEDSTTIFLYSWHLTKSTHIWY